LPETMHSKRDDLKDSFYLHIMRSSIGAGLRDHYSSSEPLPDRLTELLDELDKAESDITDNSTGHASSR